MTKYLQFNGATLQQMTEPMPEPKPILVRLVEVFKATTTVLG